MNRRIAIPVQPTDFLAVRIADLMPASKHLATGRRIGTRLERRRFYVPVL